MMIKRIGPSQPCGVGGRFDNNPKMGCFFGHMPYLPNGAAQWATIHGMGDPTHRRSYGGILVSKLQNSWRQILCHSSAPSVKKIVTWQSVKIQTFGCHDFFQVFEELSCTCLPSKNSKHAFAT